MDYTTIHKKNQERDKRRSIIITIVMAILLFVFLYFYQFTKITQKEQVVTTMLMNFGDNTMGEQSEEPATQIPPVQPIDEVQPEKPQPTEVMKEKILTGKNEKVSTKKVEKTSKKEEVKKETKTETKKETKKNTKSTETKANQNTKTSTKANTKTESTPKNVPQANTAVGNLLKGRGNKQTSQGENGTSGNAGDPLGGDVNGNSKIGVDRKLIAFIPGTMGRGGTQPTHSCSASGTITIAFTVDKAGNVTSARRLSGVSDACVVNTSTSWVKKYVKAEKSNSSSTGTYSITF